MATTAGKASGSGKAEASKSTPTRVNLQVSHDGAPVKSAHARAAQDAIRGKGRRGAGDPADSQKRSAPLAYVPLGQTAHTRATEHATSGEGNPFAQVGQAPADGAQE